MHDINLFAVLPRAEAVGDEEVSVGKRKQRMMPYAAPEIDSLLPIAKKDLQQRWVGPIWNRPRGGNDDQEGLPVQRHEGLRA